MIVFTLGTIIFPFDRAVTWLDLLLEKEIIIEPVLFQHGATSVTRLKHPLLTSVTSLTKTEMQECIKKASLVDYIQNPPLTFQGDLFNAPSLGKYFREFYQAPLVFDQMPPTANLSSGLYYD
ncbi:MAG: hypothetical protein ACRC1Z_04515 [Waterburya sp.]